MYTPLALLAVSAVLALCAAAPARADDPSCAPRDLNNPETSPLRQVPIYDQDGSGSCYAHVAATLLNTELARQGHSIEHFVNPIFAAWVNKYEDVYVFHGNNTIGGHIDEVINSVLNRHNCPAERVQACLNQFKTLGHFTDAQLSHFLEDLYSNYSRFHAGDSFQIAVNRTVAAEHINACAAQSLADELRRRGLVDVTGNEVLNSLFQACSASAREELLMPHLESSEAGPDSAVRTRIDAGLDDSHPVAVGLCSEALTHPSERHLRWENPVVIDRPSNANLREPCGNHVVTVTARKPLDGACQYLVRNTWGTLWHPRGLKCACITYTGQYQDVCADPSEAEEYLGCWYRAEDLVPNVYRTTRFTGR